MRDQFHSLCPASHGRISWHCCSFNQYHRAFPLDKLNQRLTFGEQTVSDMKGEIASLAGYKDSITGKIEVTRYIAGTSIIKKLSALLRQDFCGIISHSHIPEKKDSSTIN